MEESVLWKWFKNKFFSFPLPLLFRPQISFISAPSNNQIIKASTSSSTDFFPKQLCQCQLLIQLNLAATWSDTQKNSDLIIAVEIANTMVRICTLSSHTAIFLHIPYSLHSPWFIFTGAAIVVQPMHTTSHHFNYHQFSYQFMLRASLRCLELMLTLISYHKLPHSWTKTPLYQAL